MKIPTIDAVLETALYVGDVDCSMQFYRDVLGFELIDSGPRIAAMSVSERQVLLLCKKGASTKWAAPHDGDGELHVALRYTF